MARPQKSNKQTANKNPQNLPPSVHAPSISNLPNKTWRSRFNFELLIFATAFLLYINTLGHQFALDDAIVITKNQYTQQGFAGIPKIFADDTFLGFFGEKKNLVEGGRYRPLSVVAFAIENQLFGTKITTLDKKTIYEYSPFVGHLFNIFWYALTCIVLFWLLKELFKPLAEKFNNNFSFSPTLFALLTTLFFTAHPIHTEVVANIKGRDEIFSLLGSLAATFFALRFSRLGRWEDAIFSAVIFLLGLLSKENAITFLAIVPMAIWIFDKKNIVQSFNASLPMWAAALVFLIIRYQAIGWQFGGTPLELMNNPYLKVVNNQYIPFTASEKLATIFPTLSKYIALLIAPYPLTHDYYPRFFDLATWASPAVLGSVGLHIALLILMLKGIKERKVYAFSIGFYLVTLSIVSNIIFPVGTHMAERFAFMPSVGFSIGVSFLLWKFLKKERLAITILGIWTAIFSVITLLRNPVWRDDLTLFTTDVKTSYNSAKINNAVAGILTDEAAKKNPIDEAMVQRALIHADRAIALHSTYHNAWLLKGNAFFYLKNYDMAIKSYRQTLELKRDYADGINNLALALREGGKYYGEQKNDLNRAMTWLTEANSLKPNDVETLRLLGVAHAIGRNLPKAIEFWEKAVQLNPKDAKTMLDISMAYAQLGNAAQSQVWRQQSVALSPPQ